MEKEFVPYNLALELKELGFDELCFATWNGETLDMFLQIPSDDYFTKAPTFSQAFRWFREKHNLFGAIDCYILTPLEWFIRIDKISNDNVLDYEIDITKEPDNKTYSTHEEAELACLTKLIEIVKKSSNETI